MPRIHTLTGNLLAERTLTFAAWAPGRTQRAESEAFQVGGKGVNVSKMLRRMEAPTTALLFSGGAAGAESEAWLKARGFDFRAFRSETPTRVGLVVRAGGQAETAFLAPDAAPGADAILACAGHLDAQPGGDVLAICGSLPGWASPAFDPLRAAIERWVKRGPVAADTYGPPLAWLAERPLALVKINREECDGLLPSSGNRDAADRLRRLRDARAARRWIVTDGPRPVLSIDADGNQDRLEPPAVREVSPTGSGDVLFAAVLHGLFGLGLPLRQALEAALPFAAANAADPGVAEFPHPLLQPAFA